MSRSPERPIWRVLAEACDDRSGDPPLDGFPYLGIRELGGWVRRYPRHFIGGLTALLLAAGIAVQAWTGQTWALWLLVPGMLLLMACFGRRD